jgi:hypothetical protein
LSKSPINAPISSTPLASSVIAIPGTLLPGLITGRFWCIDPVFLARCSNTYGKKGELSKGEQNKQCGKFHDVLPFIPYQHNSFFRKNLL